MLINDKFVAFFHYLQMFRLNCCVENLDQVYFIFGTEFKRYWSCSLAQPRTCMWVGKWKCGLFRGQCHFEVWLGWDKHCVTNDHFVIFDIDIIDTTQNLKMAPSLTESHCASEGFMDKCPNVNVKTTTDKQRLSI